MIMQYSKLSLRIPSMGQRCNMSIEGVDNDEALVLGVIRGNGPTGSVILIPFAQFDLEHARANHLLAIDVLFD